MSTILARLGVQPRPGFGRAVLAAPLVLLASYLVVRGWFYPLWPDNVVALAHPFTADPALGGAWGGPTLAGAWAVHAALALVMQAACVLGLRLIYPRR
ncbi:hypothetical protein ACQPW3_19365 [Actinosynnema sp. CA-248983]